MRGIERGKWRENGPATDSLSKASVLLNPLRAENLGSCETTHSKEEEKEKKKSR